MPQIASGSAASEAESPPQLSLMARLRRAAHLFWIGFLMSVCLKYCPWLLRKIRPVVLFVAWRTARRLRENLMLNAARVMDERSTVSQRAALAQAVLGNVYDFICDLGRTQRMSDAALLGEIAAVEGRDRYMRARALGRGAILVTAHLGSFETGMIALRQEEGKGRVHVVFRRDPMKRFERVRAAQRQRFGVIEAPVDDGLPVWLGLLQALRNNEVVLMQGDRVMPGQQGQRVPFMNGHIMMPSGPIKLALASGAPIIPIFAPRLPNGRIRIVLEEPIHIQPDPARAPRNHPALSQIAAVIEGFVKQYPEQWLMMHRAWCEDALPRCEGAPAR